MAGQRNNYGKRSYSRDDDNGGSKRRNTGDERGAYAPGPEDTVYRYLCPGSKIGSILGRGGEIVKQLRTTTHAKIKIGESVPGCEERVITIFSTSNKTNTLEDTGDSVCPAQDALLRVHERLASELALGDESIDDRVPRLLARLLIPSDQIGCIIGKGGQIIQGIRTETGSQLRIMKEEQLPACAISGDELLQIRGEAAGIKKALLQVSSRLHDTPSRSNHLLALNMPQIYPQGAPYGYPDAGAPVLDIGPPMGPYGGYMGEAAGDWPSFRRTPRDETLAKEFGVRLLCSAANVGAVIGKSGGIIKQIRHESGAFIKVDSTKTEDDCIISVSAKEFFEDAASSTIDAVMRLYPRCSDKSEKESGEVSYTTRLLVPTSRVGCLIGKGGTIISEMRRTTQANIRILSKENLPKVASEDDEMVQISGDLKVIGDALLLVLDRLKASFFEREGALSSFQPSLPYRSLPNDATDESRYASRDSKAYAHGYSSDSKGHARGYSSYSSAYSDVPLSESFGRYNSYQGGGSSYGGYSGRTGSPSARLSGSNPVPHGRHYGY